VGALQRKAPRAVKYVYSIQAGSWKLDKLELRDRPEILTARMSWWNLVRELGKLEWRSRKILLREAGTFSILSRTSRAGKSRFSVIAIF
jgi:hypothetical protein